MPFTSCCISQYQCTPMKAQSELYSRVDRTQLPEDLGGTLQHNHQAWIQFHYVSLRKDNRVKICRLVERRNIKVHKTFIFQEFPLSDTTCIEKQFLSY